MSTPVEFISVEGQGPLPALPSAQAQRKGDFGFAALLDAAGAPGGEAAEPDAPSQAVAAYNVLNLLNGRFPPPDSGAGFLFTVVAMKNEAAF